MQHHLPALIIIIPLLSALIVSLMSWVDRKYCFPLSFIALATSLLSSVGLLIHVLTKGKIIYKMAGWKAPIGIVYVIDYLSAPVLVVILSVALINLVVARRLVHEQFEEKEGAFYSLYILFTAGMVGITATGDAFNLYVLLEIASLTGYALIGLGKDRAALSSLNYLFMGTIGATFYLLGVGYLYIATGSLNMADIASIIPTVSSTGSLIIFAFIICMTGLFMKMALFPMHGWLPNAYSFAPSASSGLIAPLTTKVMIYAMIRVALYIFTPAFAFKNSDFTSLIVWIAIGAIVFGSLLALSQRSLLKMLTYIVIAEVGYMVGGFWLGHKMGIIGSMIHIINDAMMTLCLFLAAGAIVYKTGSDRFEDLQGLFKKMPFTMAGFAVGAMAVIGIPPTCGFFSKWYLITGGIDAGNYYYVGALLFSSLVNAVLFFRVFEIALFEPFASHGEDGHGHSHKVSFDLNDICEAPLSMIMPLLLTAVILILLGIYSGDIVTNLIQFALPSGIA